MGKQNDIIEKGRKVAERYGFQTVDTPVVEHEELFTRSLGQQSEIVQKELFSWTHQEEQQQTPETSATSKRLSLRPEGTAGIVRAFFKPAPVSDHLKETAKNLPEKVFYAGQMFRRERPQKGRYRQFTQLGVEWISQHEHNVEVDTEMLSMAHTFLSELRVPFRLTINSLGSTESQRRFVSDLSDFLSSNLDKIEWTAEERQTLETSIQSRRLMRLLDWAHSKKGPIGEKLDKLFQLDLCPKLVAPDFLSTSSSSRSSLSDPDLHRFKELLERLQALGIPFEINPYLVRGLDYYSQTIWECVGDSADLGSQQNTILAGGRYDSLVKQCSGSDKTEGMSGIGWAAGVDRLALIVPLPPNPTRCVYVAAHHSLWDDLGADQLREVIFKSLSLVHQLRASGFKVIHHLSPSQKTKLSRQLQTAESHNTFATIIVAPSELKQDRLLIKNMDNASQTLVPFHKDSVLPFLSSIQTQTKTHNA